MQKEATGSFGLSVMLIISPEFSHHQCACFLEDQSGKYLSGAIGLLMSLNLKHQGGCTPLNTCKARWGAPLRESPLYI